MVVLTARLDKLCTPQVKVHKAQIEVCKAYVELHKAYVEPHKAKYTDMLGTQGARKSPHLTQVKSGQGTKTV